MGLRIIDDEGKDVPYGEVGEIAAIGPSVHFGYLDNPNANRDSFTAGGWFRTGDLGQFADAEGNVRIAGRKKEIINRGGKKYFPREIEELLYDIRRSCKWRSSAHPTRGLARRTACAPY